MQLILCLDQNNGLSFNNRRQSKDRMVRMDILARTEGSKLWMNAYSRRQFAEAECENIYVDETFWLHAAQTEFCFVETEVFMQCLEMASQIIVYRWDRVYPASVSVPAEILLDQWRLTEVSSFPGYSHKEITREVYSV